MKRASRERQPLALILADVDYFKAYNDYYGIRPETTVCARLPLR